MIPYKLSLQNFLSYRRPSQPLDFSNMHLAALIGANGHGKSALLDAMTWALWGRARARNDELVFLGADSMQVLFEFLLAGQRYGVTRKYHRRSGKTSLEFSIWDEEGERWQSLTEPSLRATQRRIEALLRMDYDTFIHTAFLKQGEADAFSRATPAKRKEILGRVLNLAQYDQYARRARDLAKAVQREVDHLAGRLQEMEEELEQEAAYEEEVKRAQVRETQARLQASERRRQESEARMALQALEHQKDTYQKLAARLERLQRDHQRTEMERQRLAQIVEELRAQLAQKETLAQQYQTFLEVQAQEARWNQILAERRPLEQKLQQLERAVARARADLEKKLVLAMQQFTQAREAQEALTSLAEQLEALRQEVERLTQLEQEQQQRLQRLAALRAAYAEKKQAQTRLQKQLDALPQLEAKREALLPKVAELEALKQEDEARVRRLAELKAWIQQQKQDLARLKKEMAELRSRRALLEEGETESCPVCHRPLGEDGRAHVLREYDQQLEALQQAYAEGNDRLKALQKEEKNLRKAHEHAQFDLKRLPGLQRQLAQLESRLQEYEQAEVPLAAQMEALQGVLDALAQEQAQLEQARRATEPLLRDLPARRRYLAQLEHQWAEAQRQAQALPQWEKEVAALQRRLQEGPEPALQTQIEALQAQLAALAYDPQAHDQARTQKAALQDAAEQWRRVQDAEKRLPQEKAALARIQARWQDEEAALQEEQAELAQLKQALQGLPQAQRAWEEAHQAAEEAHRVWEQAREHLGAARQRLHALSGVRKQYQALKKETAQLRAQLHRYTMLESAFGKKGLQAMLIEDVLPELEGEANRLLHRLSNHSMNVRLETRRQKKSGGMQEVLDIIISDELGSRPYELFSGGEAFRVDLALRVALSRLLARRAGASLQTLFIDEGFGTQDVQGRENLVGALRMIQDEFALILVITHIEELKDQFPVRILVEKTEEGSHYKVI